jgi:hypothetical protein
MLSEDKDESSVVTLHEDRVIEKAREFVDTVERHYPDIRRVFEKIGIPEDDVIAQALCCEVVLEVYHIPKKSDVLEKAGIRFSPTPKNPKPKKKVYIHDGKLLFALTQLAVKLYHLDPIRQKRKVMWKATKLAERVWKCSRMLQMTEMTEEGGRVGEALGGVRPSRIERDFLKVEPRFAGGPAKAGTSK